MKKETKETKGFFDVGLAKQEIAIAKEKREIARQPKSEFRSIRERLVERTTKDIAAEKKIKRLKEKIREKQLPARFVKGISRLGKKIEKGLQKRVVSRRLIKPSKTKVVIGEYKAPSILGEPNRFFKDEMEETKKSMFFQ